MEKWYKNSYRRNLVDIHIDDWNEEFLSKFDVDDYFEYLKRAHVDSAMIYLQSHVGLCYYPTKSGKMHSAFIGREDTVRRLIDKCRENNIAVVGYYSLIFNTYEEDRHPEWRLIVDKETGRSQHQLGSRYGKCCPNNIEYREFVKTQIKEIAEYFSLDGIFYDMTYWAGMCYCESCRKRFEKEAGYSEIPDVDNLKSDVTRTFMKKRYEWIAEFCKWVSDYTRKEMPNVTVSHNNAFEVSGNWHQAVWEGVSDNCDYCTGDLYGDIYDHSFCMKFYQGATQNMPFEYMVSRFAKDLKQHTVSKTQTQLDQDVFLTVAHHGANFIIDAINPDGTLNNKVAELIGNAYEKQIPYEKYMYGNSVGDIAIWYSTTGRYNTEGQDYNSRNCSANLSKTLNINHVPFNVIGNTDGKKLGGYKVIFAPAIAGLEDCQRDDILDYIRNGGTFFFSGSEEPELLKELLEAELKGYTQECDTYIAPIKEKEAMFLDFNEKYPIAMSHMHPRISGLKSEAVVEAYLKLPYSNPEDPNAFASIHSNPPGVLTDIPSVVRVPYGKGVAIWLALPVEGYDGYHYRKIIMNMLREYFSEDNQTITTNAPMQVELIAFSAENNMLISAVDMGVTEERRKIENFRINVKINKLPKRILLLPEEKEIDFTYDGSRVSFSTRELDLFDMYCIEF